MNIARQAAARSIQDAISQNENELIQREQFGNTDGSSRGGTSGRGGAGTTGALAVGVYATGRIRTGEHDGLNIKRIFNIGGVPDGGEPITYSYKTEEASLFANVVVTLPDSVLGGTMKFSTFVGVNWLGLEVRPNAFRPGTPGQIGNAENNSAMFGSTALWSLNNAYMLATVVGILGQTRLTDKETNAPQIDRYKFDTNGVITTLTAGRVYPLAAASPGLMLDLRGSVTYNKQFTDDFFNVNGDLYKTRFSTWTATLAATLFSNTTMSNGARFSPFLMTYVRQEFGWNNTLHYIENGGNASTLDGYNQPGTYGGVDAGFTYMIQRTTFGASVYYEASAKENTYGGRFRLSWQLN